MPSPQPAHRPSMPSLLLIDDDGELCGLMGRFLDGVGYRLDCCRNGLEGAERAISSLFDLVLLDVTLPGLDGFEVLRKVRQSSRIPIIMLTSRSSSRDKLTGFDGEADDYLCKPFDPEELLARVRAVLRRSAVPTDSGSRQSPQTLRISEGFREVWSGGRRIPLTAVEFELLLRLSRAEGRVVPRDELTIAIQDRQPNPFDRSLDVHISHLRAKLGEAGSGLRTVRGVGYFLTPVGDGSP